MPEQSLRLDDAHLCLKSVRRHPDFPAEDAVQMKLAQTDYPREFFEGNIFGVMFRQVFAYTPDVLRFSAMWSDLWAIF